jgi:hypothetical protein
LDPAPVQTIHVACYKVINYLSRQGRAGYMVFFTFVCTGAGPCLFVCTGVQWSAFFMRHLGLLSLHCANTVGEKCIVMSAFFTLLALDNNNMQSWPERHCNIAPSIVSKRLDF